MTAQPPQRPLRVVVASHREILARGLVAILADHPEAVAVSVGASLRGVGPAVDVVLYDLALLDDSGPTPLRELVRASAGRVIGLAESIDGPHRHVVDEHGLAGFLPTDVHAQELFGAIAAVAAGRLLPRAVEDAGPLTRREAEIVGLIAQGLSNDEIAAKLVISHNTLKSHIRQAYRRIGVSTRAQAVAWANQHGLG
ncbi:response regulator transcription factor [Nocardioides sp. CER19]|uniref:response regulator transcription factor n=1 Tax=Nocardioides sp. CER19 TaxID=3038538 RepID=UPI00244B90E2|nr:response regulator transcription factor [Nocardioides sp. CER19]MDH2414914.1 response regulator transcription factor [Nocardioides sp. CER19]